jgi:pimeloyl-ACP methyl ester carboxylesterase
LLLVNYRGYGESEGKPGEKELTADALAIHDYASRLPGVNPERIVAMGRSLGSGVAVQLATERLVRGVILVSPYDSLVEVGRRHYPFLPISLLLRHRFDSLSRAPRIEARLLCLVAAEDRVVPVAHSRALFSAWRGPKTWREIPGTDHDSIAGESEYWDSIALFLKSTL